MTSPFCGTSSVLVTFTANMKSSPSRAKRGAFGSHMSDFCVTISSLRRIPPLSALSCATMRSFHPVSASGTVNVNDTLPSASVSKSGKKNAVSCRFFRGWTSFESAAPHESAALPAPDGASQAGAAPATVVSRS